MKADGRKEYLGRGLEQFALGERIDVKSPAYKVALKRDEYLAAEGGIGGCIKDYNLDVVAIPTILGMGATSRGSRWTPTHHCTPWDLSQRNTCQALPE